MTCVSSKPMAMAAAFLLLDVAKAEVAVVGRIGLSPSYKPSSTLKRRTFSLKHGVCSKGAADMHVSYMTCLKLHA